MDVIPPPSCHSSRSTCTTRSQENHITDKQQSNLKPKCDDISSGTPGINHRDEERNHSEPNHSEPNHSEPNHSKPNHSDPNHSNRIYHNHCEHQRSEKSTPHLSGKPDTPLNSELRVIKFIGCTVAPTCKFRYISFETCQSISYGFNPSELRLNKVKDLSGNKYI